MRSKLVSCPQCINQSGFERMKSLDVKNGNKKIKGWKCVYCSQLIIRGESC